MAMAGTEKLSARTAATAKAGRHGDGRGLWLVVSGTGARKWVFRFTFAGRVTEMGLGNASVSLAAARDKAAEARKLVAAGLNPITARRETERLAAGTPTFGQCADEIIAAKASEWRNAKTSAQWNMTLSEYAKPLRALPVDEVTTADVLSALQPVWLATPETASRLRGRIEAVLDYAKAHGWRSGENPATWRGHLALILPKRQRLARGHHAALPYPDVPAFIGKLRERDAMAAHALEFTILTAGRSGEVLGTRWREVDFGTKVWTIPAGRMKAAREHRVPLSGRAMAILDRLAEMKLGEFVFPGQRAGKPLSGMALAMVLRLVNGDGATVHGFRSAFRDWAGEETHFPREIAEQALAHATGGAVEQAYRRGDALEKRRSLMEAWASFCEPGASGKVIPIRASL
jgi:integrase